MLPLPLTLLTRTHVVCEHTIVIGDRTDFGQVMSDLLRRYSDLPCSGVQRDKKQKLFSDVVQIFEDTGKVMADVEEAVEARIRAQVPVDDMMELLDELSITTLDLRKLRKVTLPQPSPLTLPCLRPIRYTDASDRNPDP